MAGSPQDFDRTIVVVDVEGFTSQGRNSLDRLALRQGLYEILKIAFTEIDVDFDSCAIEDRGDGALIVLPRSTAKSVVADRLPDRIAVALRRYNYTRVPSAQMRLRVGLNSGEVLNDGNGWISETVNTAFRILDAQAVKEAFAESGRMVAIISSERFFTDVIAHDPGLLPEAYRPLPVSIKTFTGTAYLRLLGEASAPNVALSPVLPSATSTAPTDWLDEALRELQVDPPDELRQLVPPEIPEPIPPEPDTKVDWASDAPSREDHLSRGSLADVLATQLNEVRGKSPETSFLVHLDGAWGTGKSTLLNLLEERLDDFTIVRFDAWRQSRLGPPWWALLSATREAAARERGLFARGMLRVAEGITRARRAGAAFTLAVFLIALAGTGLAVFLLPRVTGGDALATLAKAVVAVIAALAALWAGARVVGRTLLWDSVRGARLFEQSSPNPMDRVAAHFDWILGKARKPVLFFIDDLDRCPGDYVVELLDAVQTLIRDTPTRGSATRHAAAYFVVAADGAWLRKSYEDAFPSFHDSVSTPGYSLGYLFLDKLFQLTVPVPMPSTRARTTYLGRLLNVADPRPDGAVEQEITAGKTALAGADDESEILGIIDSASPAARDNLARDAALALVTPQSRARTEHALSKFLPLLHPNPRNIKKFLNTYSILRSVRTSNRTPCPPTSWPSGRSSASAGPRSRNISKPTRARYAVSSNRCGRPSACRRSSANWPPTPSFAPWSCIPRAVR
ncbi:P-loop NTPase fold protein [Amycolatopsis sp. NPDC089917]|uniref:P-loop NTPase fold protein n=1 Tax=Amycolatopsis sp. NPDC089917 TaxID=3155187 RepID=UPI00343B2046